jgi:hypothetical protein
VAWPFHGRIVEDKYRTGYPPGQIEIAIRALDSDSLRHWIERHTGDPMAHPEANYWNSVSNVRDLTVAGEPAVRFDYVMRGPEAPDDVHAVALIVNGKYVLLIDWWAYTQTGYLDRIAKVADSTVASVKLV